MDIRTIQPKQPSKVMVPSHTMGQWIQWIEDGEEGKSKAQCDVEGYFANIIVGDAGICPFKGCLAKGSKQKLVDHIACMHIKSTAWPCQDCARKFAAESKLNRHRRLKHPNQPPQIEFCVLSPPFGSNGTELTLTFDSSTLLNPTYDILFTSKFGTFVGKALNLPSQGVELHITFPASKIPKSYEAVEFEVEVLGVYHNKLEFKWIPSVEFTLNQVEEGMSRLILTHKEAETNIPATSRGIPVNYGPLWYKAAIAGDYESMKQMISKGQNINLVADRESDYSIERNGYSMTVKNKTALLLASHKGHVKVMQLLLEHGANINFDTSGWNALHEAAQGKQLLAAEFLISNNINLNSSNSDMTPLILAAVQVPYLAMVRLLLNRGARIRGYGNFTLLQTNDIVPEIRECIDEHVRLEDAIQQ